MKKRRRGETSSLLKAAAHRGVARQVQITTIDDEIHRRHWPVVDYMKIDAEGYDFFALQGAAGLLSDGAVRCGQFEYGSAWRHAGATLTRAVSWLEDKGYETRLLTVRGLSRPDPERSREYFQYSNYVFARRDLASEVFGPDPGCI